MNISTFIHPDDATALQALKNIPVFPTVVEKILEYGWEDLMWSENITSNIRLSEDQMPDIYNLLPPICQTLGIPVPELYLQLTPIPNAWTSGNTKVYIVLTLGLIRRLDEEELKSVIAHECGHILCQHVLYSMIADSIFNFGDFLMDSFLGQIGNLAMKPIKSALYSWQRASELSADRVATYITSADVLTKALAKLEGVPRSMANTLNYKAWARQGADYEALKRGNSWNKIVRILANSGLDHPYGPVRAFEARIWENSAQCRALKGISQSTLNDKIESPTKVNSDATCPICDSPIQQDWSFCKKCGYKLK